MYQVMYKIHEWRNSDTFGPLSFPTAEEREDFCNGRNVFWWHLVEDDDWHSWKRGGAWKATQEPGPADTVPEPPEITEADRWL
jgi:hypothetical protein